MPSTIEIIEADLTRPDHQRALVDLVNAYSIDAMGNGRPLDASVRDRLVPALCEHPTTLILLAYDGPRPIGIAVCFLGFSTFAARPLLNIHDLMVLKESRGQGVGRQLLAAVEAKARSLGCCKVTLEVLEHNPARQLYQSVGYQAPDYNNDAGQTLFLAKLL